jgi:peptidase M15-like protein
VDKKAWIVMANFDPKQYAQSQLQPVAFKTPEVKNEYAGLHPDLQTHLETQASSLGLPLEVTSGKRSPAENSSLPGSAQNSLHLNGEAADISLHTIPTDKVSQVVSGLNAKGFKAFVDNGDHIHVQMTGEKPEVQFDPAQYAASKLKESPTTSDTSTPVSPNPLPPSTPTQKIQSFLEGTLPQTPTLPPGEENSLDIFTPKGFIQPSEVNQLQQQTIQNSVAAAPEANDIGSLVSTFLPGNPLSVGVGLLGKGIEKGAAKALQTKFGQKALSSAGEKLSGSDLGQFILDKFGLSTKAGLKQATVKLGNEAEAQLQSTLKANDAMMPMPSGVLSQDIRDRAKILWRNKLRDQSRELTKIADRVENQNGLISLSDANVLKRDFNTFSRTKVGVPKESGLPKAYGDMANSLRTSIEENAGKLQPAVKEANQTLGQTIQLKKGLKSPTSFTSKLVDKGALMSSMGALLSGHPEAAAAILGSLALKEGVASTPFLTGLGRLGQETATAAAPLASTLQALGCSNQ